MHSPPRLICVGHCALDRVFTVESWPTGSAKIVAQRVDEAGGGMAANAAVAAARLGAQVKFWGPTGTDTTADLITAQLRDEGIDVRGLRHLDGRTTSTSAVLVDARGERLVVGYRGTALQADADWLPLQALSTADALLADVRWPAGAEVALTAARRAGVPAILDGEIAPADVLDRLSTQADHVIYAERGLAAVAGPDLDAGLQRAIASGAMVAAVTLGERGVRWIEASSPDIVRHLPAFTVPVVDTLAAGDTFHGAYAVAIAEGQAVVDAMRFAAAAAALKCTRPGGRLGSPGRQAVDALLARDGQMSRA